ncbi:sodium/proline symporter PutP [uncultured Weeksella sp.]|uniref:sodium/proline symporter PutP n=1 Tax=uncultured Weeksella sp. TaxID=1161389 RepID=UPI00259B6402|nr:sodium/proline symporter PutP [uncultured Weeksella sp.]
MNTLEYISIGIYMIMMLMIGFYSYQKTKTSSDDFLIGGRKMGALVTALSAGAADMSGWLLMGLPGAMYAVGLSSGWLAIGLTIGAFLNYVLVAPRLRVYSEVAGNAITLPVYFENRFKDQTHLLKLISSIIILVFFTLYTSSGMVAGGRLFESAFEIDYHYGLLITSLVVIIYTFLGGFLAVSLTDFVQGIIMVITLLVIPIIIVIQIGGIVETKYWIDFQSPTNLSWLEGTTTIGILSLASWGLGYFGQPHILVRFMAIDQVKDLKKARTVGITWMIFCVGGAMLIGLVGIAYMTKYHTIIDDPETIFIYFSRALFHPLISGFLLCAILAAVMSTISSQLLVTSSSMTEDFYRSFLNKNASQKTLLRVSRLSVLIVAIIALLLSISPNNSILNLVGYAWAGFGSAFGPLMLLSLLWKKTSRVGALVGLISGGLIVLFWMILQHPYKEVYAMIPAFPLSFGLIILFSIFFPDKDVEINQEFDKVGTIIEKQY